MAYIQTSKLPALTDAPVNPKPALSAAPPAPKPSPAAALDLSPTASQLLLRESNNVPWGNSPVRDK